MTSLPLLHRIALKFFFTLLKKKRTRATLKIEILLKENQQDNLRNQSILIYLKMEVMEYVENNSAVKRT